MRLYRAMLLPYPRAFRKRFGATMCETFEDTLWSAKREGLGRVLLVWARGLLDALWSGNPTAGELVVRGYHHRRSHVHSRPTVYDWHRGRGQLSTGPASSRC